MNLPNKLTIARILLVPVFMVCASQGYRAGWMLAAGIVFAAASFTDYLDGYLARKKGLVTDFGKFADPLADKLLTTTAFLYMMQLNACSVVVIVAILAREFAVSGMRMVAASKNRVVAANMWGKVKTVLQMVTVLVFYFEMPIELWMRGENGAASAYIGQYISQVLCWAVAVVTLISGVIYLWENRDCINQAK